MRINGQVIADGGFTSPGFNVTPTGQINSGTMTFPVLGSAATGNQNATTFLRGDGTFAFPTTWFTIATVGTVNDWAPGLIGNSYIRLVNPTLLVINGLGAGYQGQFVYFEATNGQVDFTNNSGSSQAANRFAHPYTCTKLSLGGAGSALFVYHTNAWRLVSFSQGKTISIAPTMTGGGSLGVAGSASSLHYTLSSLRLSVDFTIALTLTGTGNPEVRLTLPNGWTVGNGANSSTQLLRSTNNSITTVGYANAVTLGTYISLYNDLTGTTNWTVGVSASVIGHIDFDIL